MLVPSQEGRRHLLWGILDSSLKIYVLPLKTFSVLHLLTILNYVFTPVCDSVYRSVFVQEGSKSRGESLSKGGLCPGVSLSKGGLCSRRKSLSREFLSGGSQPKGFLSRGSLSRRKSLSRGVSVWGTNPEEGGLGDPILYGGRGGSTHPTWMYSCF